jgi:hypothetical protein
LKVSISFTELLLDKSYRKEKKMRGSSSVISNLSNMELLLCMELLKTHSISVKLWD